MGASGWRRRAHVGTPLTRFLLIIAPRLERVGFFARLVFHSFFVGFEAQKGSATFGSTEVARLRGGVREGEITM